MPVASAAGGRVTANTVPEVPIEHDHVARPRRRGRARRPRCRPRPGRAGTPRTGERPPACSTGRLGGTACAAPLAPAAPRASRSGPVAPRPRRTSSLCRWHRCGRCITRSRLGRTCQPPGEPVVRQADGRRAGGRSPVSCSASQRSLRHGERGDRHTADRLRPPSRRAPDHPRRARRPVPRPPRAERCRSTAGAGRTTRPVSSRQTMPCCCAPTETAATPSSPPAPARADVSACHQAAGSTSVPGGCAARPSRTSAPAARRRGSTTLHDCVDESIPADQRRSSGPRADARPRAGSAHEARSRGAGRVGVEVLERGRSAEQLGMVSPGPRVGVASSATRHAAMRLDHLRVGAERRRPLLRAAGTSACSPPPRPTRPALSSVRDGL